MKEVLSRAKGVAIVCQNGGKHFLKGRFSHGRELSLSDKTTVVVAPMVLL